MFTRAVDESGLARAPRDFFTFFRGPQGREKLKKSRREAPGGRRRRRGRTTRVDRKRVAPRQSATRRRRGIVGNARRKRVEPSRVGNARRGDARRVDEAHAAGRRGPLASRARATREVHAVPRHVPRRPVSRRRVARFRRATVRRVSVARFRRSRAVAASRFVAVRRASGQRASSDRVVDVAPLGPRDEIFSTFLAPGAREKR